MSGFRPHFLLAGDPGRTAVDMKSFREFYKLKEYRLGWNAWKTMITHLHLEEEPRNDMELIQTSWDGYRMIKDEMLPPNAIRCVHHDQDD